MRSLTSFISRVSKEFKSKSHGFYKHKTQSFSTSGPVARKMAAGLEVKVISRDMIKPSCPTPPHLQTLRFSLFDQIIHSVHIPFIFFYENDPKLNTMLRSKSLKQSLSETLVEFYPLAGRIHENVSIDCNDQGAEFSEAFLAANLRDVITNPNPQGFQELLPFTSHKNNNVVLGVQVNHFSCGGTAIGVSLSHKTADGAAFSDFLTAWTAKAAQATNNKIIGKINVHRPAPPKFCAASIIPPMEALNGICAADSLLESDEKVGFKRLIFQREKIEELKAEAARCGQSEITPTTVEVVSAFIMKRMMETSAINPSFPKISTAVYSVDLRPRVVPSVPEGFFGNFVWIARTCPFVGGAKTKYFDMVCEMRKAIKKINSNYMTKLISAGGESMLEQIDHLLHDSENCVTFSILCRLPLYEADFGMGKPVWVCVNSCSIKHTVSLLRTSCGNGIEAWIQMLEDDIAKLDLNV